MFFAEWPVENDTLVLVEKEKRSGSFNDAGELVWSDGDMGDSRVNRHQIDVIRKCSKRSFILNLGKASKSPK